MVLPQQGEYWFSTLVVVDIPRHPPTTGLVVAHVKEEGDCGGCDIEGEDGKGEFEAM
jgi:hypothetical protein